MQYFDISVPITNEMTVWPKDPKVILKRVQKIETGDNANVSHLQAGVHTGTHVDAPYHFLQNGKTVEALRLDVLNGRAYVLHLPESVDVVDAKIFAKFNFPPHTQRLLIKTRNSNIWNNKPNEFDTTFVGISADGAEELVKRGVKLIGIDYLSVAPYKQSRPTHEILLGAELIILEGLDLSKVTQGYYTLHCLPLKLMGADGAPARAILVKR
jgi:arylformamidase